MYNFRIYYSVKGKNRRRVKKISFNSYYTLLEAWATALDWAVAYTQDDEILNSIQIIKEREDER